MSQADDARERAKRTVQKFGFENPVVTDESIWFASYNGCSGSDSFSFEISATKHNTQDNSDKKESMTVCCSAPTWINSMFGIMAKGCTIRGQ